MLTFHLIHHQTISAHAILPIRAPGSTKHGRLISHTGELDKTLLKINGNPDVLQAAGGQE